MSTSKKDKQNVKDFAELATIGFANSLAPGFPISKEEESKMIDEATEAFWNFLTALKCDWKKDPNSADTPRRVAKAYIKDLWAGRYRSLLSSDGEKTLKNLTAFPPDGYTGMVLERNIPLTSMCSHHHQAIRGVVNVAYLPGEKKGSKVIGLSKINRVVEQFWRRGAIQEQLTMAIHNAVDKMCKGNIWVAVNITATHNCVSCRGVRHEGADMVTNQVSGKFRDPKEWARKEFFDSIKL